jgi:hypothetical protein
MTWPRAVVDPRTGQEIPEDVQDTIFASVWGSVEKGRQAYDEAMQKAERGEIALIGVGVLF